VIATLGELLERLQQLHEAGAELDCAIRVAFQPSYPLAATVDVAVHVEDSGEHPEAVWIAVGESVPYGENPYAPRGAWGTEDDY